VGWLRRLRNGSAIIFERGEGALRALHLEAGYAVAAIPRLHIAEIVHLELV